MHRSLLLKLSLDMRLKGKKCCLYKMCALFSCIPFFTNIKWLHLTFEPNTLTSLCSVVFIMFWSKLKFKQLSIFFRIFLLHQIYTEFVFFSSRISLSVEIRGLTDWWADRPHQFNSGLTDWQTASVWQSLCSKYAPEDENISVYYFPQYFN